MKVLHVIPSLSTAHGGPTQALLMMERALRAAGVDVETATTDDDGPGRRARRPAGQRVAEEGAVRWYFPRTLEFYKVAPSFVPWIARAVKRFDIVHIHSLFSFTTPAAAWAAHRADVPYVIRPLGTLDRYGVDQRRPALKSLSMRLIEKPLVERAAAVHFTSRAEAVEARRLGWHMREAVVPLAVALESTPGDGRAFSRDGLRMLFLSRLDPKKNIESLIDAVAIVSREVPGLELAIAGAGDPGYVSALRERAARKGITVEWLGHVAGDAKARAWAQADVFVLPSFSENFGVAAAEALAAGLPCILGEGVALAPDIVFAQAGAAVLPDAASLARAIRAHVNARSQWPEMSRNAVRLAQERFSPDAMGRALKQLYADILTR